MARAAPYADADAVLARARETTRKTRRSRTATPEDVAGLAPTFNKLAGALRQSCPPLREQAHEDLVQECFARTLAQLPHYCGRSGIKTWAVRVARNHLVSQARAIASRPKVNIVDVDIAAGAVGSCEPCYTPDFGRRLVLRSQTKDLLGWLSDRPDGIDQGWAVLNLLMKTHGNWDYTASALCLHTGQPWTTERVRNVVRAIKDTFRGRALCDSLGITTTTVTNYDGAN